MGEVIDLTESDDEQPVASTSRRVINGAAATSAPKKTGGGLPTPAERQQMEAERVARQAKRELEGGDGKDGTVSKKPKVTQTGPRIATMSSIAGTGGASFGGTGSYGGAGGSSSKPQMKYKGGRILLARTEGRRGPNAVSLDELVHGQHLKRAWLQLYFIDDEWFFSPFPLTRGPGGPPLTLVRDFKMDGQVGQQLRMKKLGEKPATVADIAGFSVDANKIWKKLLGDNLTTAYSPNAACSHSKVMLLEYDGFLRVVITSANALISDYDLTDNHFFVQDFPPASPMSNTTAKGKSFKKRLFAHLSEAGVNVPDVEAALTPFRDYDFSSVKVSIVGSKPGTHEDQGIARLRDILEQQDLLTEDVKKCRLEVAAASLGRCGTPWLSSFLECAGVTSSVPNLLEKVLSLVYPSKAHMEAAPQDQRDGPANNMGAHFKTNGPGQTDGRLKNTMRQFTSKDPSVYCYHMKLFMLFTNWDEADVKTKPRWIVIGSHNFSQAAWGTAEEKGSSGWRSKGINNHELGVVIAGDDIESMLEPGSSWDEIVPYKRPAVPYGPQDRHWNSPMWAQGH